MYSVDDVFNVIKDALGDQYKVEKLKNGQIWANESSGSKDKNDTRTYEGSANQDAFNRIMKKIALEDGNEFNSMYLDRGEGTEINRIIDYAVDNNMISNNVKKFLNIRQGGKYSTKQSETPEDKLKRTLKERFWATDSVNGGNFSGRETNVGHIYPKNKYPELARYYDNTREEIAQDNQNYKDFTGAELMDINDKLLEESRRAGVDVDEMEADVTAQMLVDSLPKEERAKAMVILGMATADEVGLRSQAKEKAQGYLRRL